MRMVIRGAVALVILVAAYWGWALAGAAQLASAASRDDPEAVMERVDLQPLIRSLSSQISRAYLDQNPELRKLLSEHGLGGGVAINAAGAEPLLRAFLTPENIAALLNRGTRRRRRPGRRHAFRRALARRGVPRPALAGPDELLFRRSAELRRWPAKSRWAVPPPHASFRRHVAPVGRRHSRAGHCPGGAADRASDQRSGERPRRVSRFRLLGRRRPANHRNNFFTRKQNSCYPFFNSAHAVWRREWIEKTWSKGDFWYNRKGEPNERAEIFF